MVSDATGGAEWAYAATIQPDGKIVATGGSSEESFLITRYRTNGRPDRSFGSAGVVLTDFGTPASATAVALQPDGRIVTAGATGPYPGDFALARHVDKRSHR